MSKIKQHLELLGATVFPIVKRSQYGASTWDRIGNLDYLQGEEKRKYANRVVDEATKEQRKENKRQEWMVFSVNADETFTLRSELGYEQANVSRSDFRLIKKNKMAKKEKPILKVSKKGFVNFMMDDDGVEIGTIKKELNKKGVFTLEDIVKNCGYIPSGLIKSKVPDNLKSVTYDEKGKTFEVQPSDFNIIFV